MRHTVGETCLLLEVKKGRVSHALMLIVVIGEELVRNLVISDVEPS